MLFIGVIFGWVNVSVSHFGISRALALNDLEPGYGGWEAQYEYINLDTVWHKADNLVFDKPVYIDGEATLTIESGAVVHLNGGDLTVNQGGIVATGTQDEPITITSDANKPFTIIFQNWDSYSVTSQLQYVHIKGGGYYTNPSECDAGGVLMMNTNRAPFFINTANASGSCPPDAPAILYTGGKVLIEHSDFIDNHYADIRIERIFHSDDPENFFRVNSSNFGSNLQSTGVIAESFCEHLDAVHTDYKDYSLVRCQQEVTMSGNWWGDASGPRYDSAYFPASRNMGGMGESILKNGDVVWSPPANTPFDNGMDCLKDCFSNVLFLPGVEASRLYAYDDPNCVVINCENQLWEPNRNEDVRKLYLDKDGKSAAAYDIYTRDVIDETDVVGQNIYKSFIAKLDALKNTNHLINDWAPVPYDWRLSLEDILNGGTIDGNNISYNEPSIAPHIIAELHRLAASSRTGKVTLVTHSNGGLVAKALMQKIGDEETKKLIDEVVMVGVPQVGTPVAIGAMLHGYGQDLLGGLILAKPVARGLAEYMPSAYTLLPSDHYFDAVQTPVVSFDAKKLPEWSAKYGAVIDTPAGMQNFLTDGDKRVDATSLNIEDPTKVHASLLDAAVTRHAAVDAWVAPAGVRVVQIAGWGVPATVSGMHYTTEDGVVCTDGLCSAPQELLQSSPVFTMDGDGTVVTPSALRMGDVERYWVDINQYDKSHQITTLGGRFGPEHSNIFEILELDTFITDLITHTSKPVSDYTYIKIQAPSTNKDRLQYSLHSPLSLDLYDEQGRHTGLDKDGNIEEQIPGTYYRQFGEVKYIFSESGTPYHIVMNGYDKGTFTLEVEALRGDVSTGKIVFKDMPTTTHTKATLDISHGIESVSDLTLDEDGNGTLDYRIHPKLGKVVTLTDDDEPVTTLYAVSYNNEVTSTVSASGKKETKHAKHQEKQHKKDKRSKREIKREQKIQLQLAMRKNADMKRKKAQIDAEKRQQEKQEAMRVDAAMVDSAVATPSVVRDSVSGDTVLESQYQEISNGEPTGLWQFQIIVRKASDEILQKLRESWHQLWFSW
jgi:pimeloyl-ACP methyl ester carboxylesterase